MRSIVIAFLLIVALAGLAAADTAPSATKLVEAARAKLLADHTHDLDAL